jgi:predicted small secreted protein
MKLAATILLVSLLTACGTVGGAVSGAGDDLKKAGEWVKTR